MFKIILIILIIFTNCTVLLKDLGSTSSQTVLGILIGLKPADSDFIISEEPTSIEEGTSKSIRVHLGKKPESDTFVTISSDSSAIYINNSNKTNLEFTPSNYSTDQTFTITSLIDNNKTNESSNITIIADYGYTPKTWKITNVDKQGSDNWIAIFPEEVFLPFSVSTVNIKIKLNIKPSENITVSISPTFIKSPFLNTGYDNSGMTINSTLIFTPSNYSNGQTAMIVGYDSIFNPDIINNQKSFRLLAYSSTFSAKADVNVFKNSIDARSRVETIAGNSSISPAGSTNGTGTAALFNTPYGLTIDKEGRNLYIADYGNTLIRKIALSSRAVTTIAGSLKTTTSEDGLGIAAKFRAPLGIATDGTNLYVSDYLDHIIRKIELSTGDVTTLAGIIGTGGFTDGVGTAAKFNGPYGLSVFRTNLYIADSGNNKIRKINLLDKTVTTMAGIGVEGSDDGVGTTVAKFKKPFGVTTDGVNIYIADSGNHTIRKMSLLTGIVSTIAGSPGVSGTSDGIGSAGKLNSPYQLTTDATNLYISDYENHTIRRLEISSGSLTTISGIVINPGSLDGFSPSAKYQNPDGIATNGSELFVADSWNCTIRKISELLF